jgi:hypothetical protein
MRICGQMISPQQRPFSTEQRQRSRNPFRTLNLRLTKGVRSAVANLDRMSRSHHAGDFDELTGEAN